LDLVPGVISSEASFATSSATTTVNLETFARTSRKNDPNYKFNPYDGSALSEIRNSIESEAQQMVENVGFDASILTADDDIELSESNEIEPEKAKILDNDGLDTDETLVDDECVDNDVEGIASLQVGGMSCAVCTGRVEKTILSVSGVKSAAVSLATCRAKVQFLKDKASIDSEIKNRISELATQCSDAVNKAGYDCEVLDVYSSSDENAGGLTLAESAAKLEASRINELKNWSRLLLVSSAFTIPLVFMHYQDMHSSMTENSDEHMKDWMSLFLATPVQFGVGKRFYAAAYHSFMNGRVMGMDFLVCLGTTAAYLYSVIVLAVMIYATPSDFEANGTHLKPMFETGAMLLTFVTLGKYLEAYARGKTASALQTLMELQSTIATRCNIPKECISESGSISDYANINAMQKTEVEIKDVQVGDFLIVIPGARIPTDGVLVHQGDNSRGGVYIDESALSGEPFPVAKKIGDDLYGSTVNQFSVLIIRVTATGGKTVLARIVRLIEEAQVNRAPIQALADYIASIFAPGVMFLSALTFICWAIFNSEADNQERFFVALMSSISVIVVACPCALGLATPTAVMVGTGVGASNGLLIKGGAVLEEAHSVDTVIFDKTGTMTTGRAIVNERMEFLDDTDDSDPVIQNLPNSVNKGCIALWLAACAEMNSAHPLAHAIVAAAKGVFGNDFTCSRDNVSVSNFITVPGGGVESVIEKKDWGRWKVRVGKRSFVFDDKVEIATSER
jgi:Cu+-exporting ATPase